MSMETLLHDEIQAVDVNLEEDEIEFTDQIVVEHETYSIAECLPCFNSRTEPKSGIPYKNILWCEGIDEVSSLDVLCITYLHTVKNDFQLKKIYIRVKNKITPPKSDITTSQTKELILLKAYPHGITARSVLILINPMGGKGQALEIYRTKILPVLEAAQVNITYKETEYHGHAKDIARDLDPDLYDMIICCSGDGIPHQVINGFYEKPDKGVKAFSKVIITHLPCGSGNGFSLSTHGTSDATHATLLMLKAKKTRLDLMAVTQGVGDKEKTSLSFLSQCFGIIADADIGTEHLRWMGPIRFDLGVLYGILKRVEYPCDLYVKYVSKKDNLEEYYSNNYYRDDSQLADLSAKDLETFSPKLDQPPPSDWERFSSDVTSKLNVFYVGKMPYISKDVQFFPAALPNDGSMDMIISDTRASLTETISSLSLIEKGTHVLQDNIHHSKISSYRLIPKLKSTDGHFLSVDGELFPIEPLQVDILPGVMISLLQDGSFVSTSFT